MGQRPVHPMGPRPVHPMGQRPVHRMGQHVRFLNWAWIKQRRNSTIELAVNNHSRMQAISIIHCVIFSEFRSDSTISRWMLGVVSGCSRCVCAQIRYWFLMIAGMVNCRFLCSSPCFMIGTSRTSLSVAPTWSSRMSTYSLLSPRETLGVFRLYEAGPRVYLVLARMKNSLASDQSTRSKTLHAPNASQRGRLHTRVRCR